MNSENNYYYEILEALSDPMNAPTEKVLVGTNPTHGYHIWHGTTLLARFTLDEGFIMMQPHVPEFMVKELVRSVSGHLQHSAPIVRAVIQTINDANTEAA